MTVALPPSHHVVYNMRTSCTSRLCGMLLRAPNQPAPDMFASPLSTSVFPRGAHEAHMPRYSAMEKGSVARSLCRTRRLSAKSSGLCFRRPQRPYTLISVRARSSLSDVSQAASSSGAHTSLTDLGDFRTKGYGSAPPPQPGDHPPWVSEVLPTPVPSKFRVYCNRALNMKQIKAVGFDMDYTLAQYRPETFEGLAHKETVEKLVRNFKYPEELRELTFIWDYMMKGLIIDKNRGNMLKVDRHRYVKIACHGFVPLDNDARKRVYNSESFDASFDEPHYAMVDTLFSLAEAYLFMQLVEMKDLQKYDILSSKSYSELYRDLRTAVDMCHRDGSLKKAVTGNPSHFIHYDPLMPQMLEVLRGSGRKVFLATNSLWDYTNVVMNYLLLGKSGSSKSLDWLSYFDVVMVGCGKPAFFQNRGQLFSVDVRTGALYNTDNGAPTVPLEDPDLLTVPPIATVAPPLPSPSSSDENGSSSNGSSNGALSSSWASVFQGGCYKDVHRMLGIRSGEELMYVGDHIYGDIVKSKKSVGWRTMLVVPELEVELSMQEHSKKVHQELRLLRAQRDTIDDEIQRYEWALKQDSMPGDPASYAKNMELLRELRLRRDSLKARHSKLLANHHRQFHPIWGQLLKTGHQNSRFAHQMERFACLYTSHVSNLAFYSPEKSFMGRMDYMAHEDFEEESLI